MCIRATARRHLRRCRGRSRAARCHRRQLRRRYCAASCNRSCADVFTISLHQENNYPFVKPASSIDVNLPDGCGDEEYLAWLDNALSSGLRQFEPELISYVAGADPFREDQLGGLNMSVEGLKRRDELVFRAARARNIPVMTTYRGGICRAHRRHGDNPLQHGGCCGGSVSCGRIRNQGFGTGS